MNINWTKPIETVPDERNPIPIPCEVVRIYADGHVEVRFGGVWVGPDGIDRSSNVTGTGGWWFDAAGDPHYRLLPLLRNAAQ